jgi:hypothetical protein
MMRQIGKQILTIAAWLLLAHAGQAAALVTTIVTDPLTGVAIDGYDPVSYFIDSEPQMGKPDFEYVWEGVSWYFESAANRDVFIRSPTVYAPQYGGHCLMSLSRGYLSDGKPRLYVIDALKLFFFYSTANRDAFLLSKAEALGKAAANWPNLSKDLSGVRDEEPVAEPVSSAEEPDPSVAPDAAEANVPAH